MIIKQVNEFGKKTTRQRIDINKSDNLETSTEVVIIPLVQYQEQTKKLEELKKEVELLTGIFQKYKIQYNRFKNSYNQIQAKYNKYELKKPIKIK